MEKFLTAALLLAIFAGLIVSATKAWQTRRREQAIGFSSPAETLPDNAALTAPAKAQYVATVIAGEPLNRVTAHGLGFRGRAQVAAGTGGILISRKGERDLAIATSQLTGFDFEQAVIDRAVEENGLLAIHWIQDATALTTVLRFNNAAERSRVLQSNSALTRKAIQ